jgi:hypothetical protein
LRRLTPVGPERVASARREPLRSKRHGGQILGAHVVQVARVVARHDQRVPARHGVDVHEAHGELVGVDDRPRKITRDDLAEHAVCVRWHARSV